MTELEKQHKILEHLEAVVKLGCSTLPLYSLEIQRLIGQVQFQIWIREGKE